MSRAASFMDGPVDIVTLIDSLGSRSESTRKLAAFQLQNLVEDPEFVNVFVEADGMPALDELVLQEQGNTLAYALGSLARILELDYGWDQVSDHAVERAVDLVVAQPNINVLRNAFAFLVLVVSRPPDNELDYPMRHADGSRMGPDLETLKPILKERSNFLDSLIEKLSSADHALCANALKFMNALVRDSILTFSETQLMRFVKRLQDLEIFSTVEGLMRGEILEEDIAAQVLDFQTLTKVMLRCWRFVPVDMSRQAHREALESIRRTAKKALGRSESAKNAAEMSIDGARTSRSREKRPATSANNGSEDSSGAVASDLPSWKVVGFDSEDPARDLDDTGLLGLMDLADFVRKNNDFFERALLEQSVLPGEQRCPIARACLSVTRVLYDHFEIGASSASPRASSANLLVQLRKGPYQVDDEAVDGDAFIAAASAKITPLLLARDKLHGALTHAFFRLWAAAEASAADFGKIELLVRLLVARTVGSVTRQAQTQELEDSIDAVNLAQLRKWQLEELDKQQDHSWGQDLGRLRDRVHEEAVQFMQEQRIRCLLQGAWFPWLPDPGSPGLDRDERPPANALPDLIAWSFVRLDPRRRYLHHAQFPQRLDRYPLISELPQRIDVQRISSVVSNVEAGVALPAEVRQYSEYADAQPSSGKQLQQVQQQKGSQQQPQVGNKKTTTTAAATTAAPSTTAGGAGEGTVTRLTIRGADGRETGAELPLLELQTADSTTASEWLDGLLMLLDQEPITADTNRLIEIIGSWSLKVRTLDLLDDDDFAGGAAALRDRASAGGKKGGAARAGAKTNSDSSAGAEQSRDGSAEGVGAGGAGDDEYSREGLGDDYWYDMGEN